MAARGAVLGIPAIIMVNTTRPLYRYYRTYIHTTARRSFRYRIGTYLFYDWVLHRYIHIMYIICIYVQGFIVGKLKYKLPSDGRVCVRCYSPFLATAFFSFSYL